LQKQRIASPFSGKGPGGTACELIEIEEEGEEEVDDNDDADDDDDDDVCVCAGYLCLDEDY
jgi:hypothetical protein